MRVSLVILFCLFIAVVNSATTKAPVRKSAYAYLRTVRGKNSCAGGSCPYWERHGRSFVTLRCYAEQYQDCVCLHRMCYRSCLFDRKECDAEMKSCLKQICPRCTPASQSSICPAHNAMVDKLSTSFSTMSCYSCCPNVGNTTRPQTTGIIINPPGSNNPVASNGGGNRPPNGGNSGNVVNTGNNRPLNGGNTGNSANTGNSRPPNGGNGANIINNRPPNGVNGGSSQGVNGNQGLGGSNAGGAAFSGNANANANAPSQNQQAKQTIRSTTRRVTTRPATTKRVQNKP